MPRWQADRGKGENTSRHACLSHQHWWRVAYLSAKVGLVETEQVRRLAERVQIRQARQFHVFLSPNHGNVFAPRRSLSSLHLLRNDGRAPIVPGKNSRQTGGNSLSLLSCAVGSCSIFAYTCPYEDTDGHFRDTVTSCAERSGALICCNQNSPQSLTTWTETARTHCFESSSIQKICSVHENNRNF